MVGHCGGRKTDGDCVHRVTLADTASGWTECVAMRTRNQMLAMEAFDKVTADLPFAMLRWMSDPLVHMHARNRWLKSLVERVSTQGTARVDLSVAAG